jgi:hypothetical protein
MRENNGGRDKVPVWRVAQRVYGAIDNWPGSVVSVDAERGTFTVQWSDGMFPVVYPVDTIMVREAWPWE